GRTDGEFADARCRQGVSGLPRVAGSKAGVQRRRHRVASSFRRKIKAAPAGARLYITLRSGQSAETAASHLGIHGDPAGIAAKERAMTDPTHTVSPNNSPDNATPPRRRGWRWLLVSSAVAIAAVTGAAASKALDHGPFWRHGGFMAAS